MAARTGAAKGGATEEEEEDDGGGRGAEPEMTAAEAEAEEEEKLAVRRRCLRCVDFLLILIGAGMCGGSLYASTFMYTTVGEALMYGAAGVGGGILAAAALGMFAVCTRRTQTHLLLLFFTFLIFLSFAMLVLGGFCFILTNSAVAYLQANWDKIVASMPPDKRAAMSQEATTNNVRYALYGLGGGAIVVFFICATAMSNAVALVTATRAYTVFLQATNIALLPIGVALIAAAAYVADTAVAAEAAAAAFAIFILGTFVIVLPLLGCVGTSLQSRGIVRLFMFFTTLLALAFLTFGILSLVQSSMVAGLITGQWDTLRRVLPPDFSGRYDREVFQRFVDTNLTALGFLAVCAGVVLLAQSWAAFRLRSELKFESELEQEAWDAVKNNMLPADVAETITKSHAKGRVQVMWKQQWTKGTRTSRRLIMCGCCLLVSAVVLAVGTASAALYYSTSCTHLSGYTASHTFDTRDVAPYVYVYSNYSLGTIRLGVDASLATPAVTLTMTKGALKDTMANTAWPDITAVNRTVVAGGVDALGVGVGVAVSAWGIDAVEAAKTTYLGYDVACQHADLTVVVPRAAVYTGGAGNSRVAGDAAPLALLLAAQRGSAGIDLDMSHVAAANRPRIRSIEATTTAGAIGFTSLLLGSAGVTASTTLGEIALTDVAAECDPASVGSGVGGLALRTTKGTLSLLRTTTLNCDVTLTVTQALASVDGSTITNTLGGGTLAMVGTQGMMQVSNTAADVLDLKSDSGSVRVNNVTAAEALKVSSSSGDVQLTAVVMAPRGVLQVETDSGDITISTARFRGIISVVTSGGITCTGGATTGFDDPVPCAVTAGGSVDSSGGQTVRIVEQVTVNCKSATRNDCPYLGQITITSASGNVNLQMAKVAW